MIRVVKDGWKGQGKYAGYFAVPQPCAGINK